MLQVELEHQVKDQQAQHLDEWKHHQLRSVLQKGPEHKQYHAKTQVKHQGNDSKILEGNFVVNAVHVHLEAKHAKDNQVNEAYRLVHNTREQLLVLAQDVREGAARPCVKDMPSPRVRIVV